MNWLLDLLDSAFAKATALIAALITILGAAYAAMRWFGWHVRFEPLEKPHGKSERAETPRSKCAFCDGSGKMEGDWRLRAASGGTQIDIVPCKVCGGKGLTE